MKKPLISPVSEREVKIAFKVKKPLSDKIDSYIDYLKSFENTQSIKKENVISEFCQYVIDKDKGYKDWIKANNKSKSEVVE